MSARRGSGLVAWGVGLLLWGALASPAAALTHVTACGSLVGTENSFVLDSDLTATSGTCITMTANGQTLNLNGHTISGLGAADGAVGITGSVGGGLPKNATIKGPGIVHDFSSFCIALGDHALVEDVLVYDCAGAGISLGNFSKCVQCRVHDILQSEGSGTGIILGNGCLLEASIVETSDRGARVGHNCKVWDLVLERINEVGLKVGSGTAVARTVISGSHNGPGLDYCDCGKGGPEDPTTGLPDGTLPGACVDSSNAVTGNGRGDSGNALRNDIADSTSDPAYGDVCRGITVAPVVITNCGTVTENTSNTPVRYNGTLGSTGRGLQCPGA